MKRASIEVGASGLPGRRWWMPLPILALVAGLLLAATACHGGRGGAGFTSSGGVQTHFPQPVDASTVVIQRDGKIVVGGGPAWCDQCGYGWLFALVRYQPDGSLDPSFGKQGKALGFFRSAELTRWAVALQRDGKILAAGVSDRTGRTVYPPVDFALARYTPAGRVDRSFGGGRAVLTDIGSERSDLATAIATQPDGKIVVAGSTGPGSQATADVALARFLPDGRLDSTFGTGGRVRTDFGPENDGGAYAAIVQPDGKILVSGQPYADFSLVRYLRDGRLDRRFGVGGTVRTSSGGGALALQPNGRIIVAGDELWRYERDGHLDRTFGTGGMARISFRPGRYDRAAAVAIQPDGKIIVAGTSSAKSWTRGEFALARYLPSGRLDSTFGDGGRVLTDVGPNTWNGALDVAVQANGKIVAVGSVGGRARDFGVVRYNRDGTLDDRFRER